MLWLTLLVKSKAIYTKLRNNAHVIIPCLFILLVCVALWGLNTSNHQLTATNERLERLSDSKDAQINELQDKNDDLADGVQKLTAAIQKQNVIMSDVLQQRADADQYNKALQSEIKTYLHSDQCAKSAVNRDAVDRLRQAAEANGVPDSHSAVSADPGRANSANH